MSNVCRVRVYVLIISVPGSGLFLCLSVINTCFFKLNMHPKITPGKNAENSPLFFGWFFVVFFSLSTGFGSFSFLGTGKNQASVSPVGRHKLSVPLRFLW